MVRNLQVSDDLYRRLVNLAQERGATDVESLLERLLPATESQELQARNALVQRIHEQRQRLFEAHGEMVDSGELLREDRGR